MNPHMKESFRESFIEHVAVYRVSLARMARETGISKSLLQSLHQRKTICPNVDDAMKIAEYFGKSVEEFVGTSKDDQVKRLTSLAARLSPDEQAFLEAQLETILSRQGRKS